MPAVLPCTTCFKAALKGQWGKALETAVHMLCTFREQEQDSEDHLHAQQATFNAMTCVR